MSEPSLPPEFAQNDYDNQSTETAAVPFINNGIILGIIGLLFIALVFLGVRVISNEMSESNITELVGNNEASIQSVNKEITSLKAMRDELNGLVTGMGNKVEGHRESLENDVQFTNQRIDDLEASLKRVAMNLDEKITALTQQKTKAAVAARNKKVARKAKSLRPIPAAVSLVSIRKIGHSSMVHLRNQQGRHSPLLKIGDRWEGWEYLAEEESGAVFKVNGKKRTLYL